MRAASATRSDAVRNYLSALAIMERLTEIDTTNQVWQADVIEYNFDLALNGDNSADRFAFVVGKLKKFKSERQLSAEQASWLTEAERRLTRPRRSQ
jgi:hypothetical protein